MYDAVWTASEALAIGLDLERNRFTDLMRGGVQLLAPTGSDLSKYSEKNDILAGFHYGKVKKLSKTAKAINEESFFLLCDIRIKWLISSLIDF